jgi:hypothetical protein
VRPRIQRRWQSDKWADKKAAALKSWLLDGCEERSLWYGDDGQPRPVTVNRLADLLVEILRRHAHLHGILLPDSLHRERVLVLAEMPDMCRWPRPGRMRLRMLCGPRKRLTPGIEKILDHSGRDNDPFDPRSRNAPGPGVRDAPQGLRACCGGAARTGSTPKNRWP